MSIKATFPAGVDELIVHGLHQWDYGQTLQVEASGLPALVEVHFACSGMTDAVVRHCSVIDNMLTAVIPDECLEQTSPVVAWVYCIEGTEGATRLTVVMPPIARARPATAATAPAQITNDYTELLNEINERVELLNMGGVKVTNAAHADTAGRASSADHALTASDAQRAMSAQAADYATESGYADEANRANQADFATEASQAGGLFFAEHVIPAYAVLSVTEDFQQYAGELLPNGLYQIIDDGNMFLLDSNAVYSPVYCGGNGVLVHIRDYRLEVIHKGDNFLLNRYVREEANTPFTPDTLHGVGTIKYRCLMYY